MSPDGPAQPPGRVANGPARFHALDVLRGLAALSVVLWHWQHFFLPFDPQGAVFVREQQPFYALLYLFYGHGDAAVQLFFCLSGFIFFWLYSQPIAERRIAAGEFAVLRASRLYPLHLATLVLVAVGQWFYTSRVHAPFVYLQNDPLHLVLHLLFVSGWIPGHDGSFNGPVWSVSIEILIYGVFFAFSRVFRRAPWAMILMIAIGYVGRAVLDAVGLGLMGFFVGGLMYVLYDAIVRAGLVRRLVPVFGGVAIAAWTATLVLTRPGVTFDLSALPWLVRRLITGADVLVLFPVTILALACAETARGTLGRRAAWLGDLSYSTYLLHFPLQLLVVLVAGPRVPTGPGALVAFFALVLAVSFASHRWFELPSQRAWRRRAGVVRTRP